MKTAQTPETLTPAETARRAAIDEKAAAIDAKHPAPLADYLKSLSSLERCGASWAALEKVRTIAKQNPAALDMETLETAQAANPAAIAAAADAIPAGILQQIESLLISCDCITYATTRRTASREMAARAATLESVGAALLQCMKAIERAIK